MCSTENKFQELLDKVRLRSYLCFYMQLVQMDCEEPITFTAMDIKDDVVKVVCNACKGYIQHGGVAVTHRGKYYHAGCFTDAELINASK